MSNWLVAIIGGAIATVIGGLILFYILPSQQVAGLASPSVGPAPPVSTAGRRHLRCTMKGGTMAGRIFSFSIDVLRKEAVWTDNGIALNIGRVDKNKILTTAKYQLPGPDWPKHTHVFFDFNRATLTVQARLGREPDELSTGFPAGFVLDVGGSDGECVETARAF